VSSLQCCRGELGQPGRPGSQGFTGEPGDNGLPGTIGFIGPPGQQGFTGQPGFTGLSGAQGQSGLPGDTGGTGFTGLSCDFSAAYVHKLSVNQKPKISKISPIMFSLTYLFFSQFQTSCRLFEAFHRCEPQPLHCELVMSL